DRFGIALEIGEVADRHLAQHDTLADRGIPSEPAGFQLRRRVDARFRILETQLFRSVHAPDLRRRPRAGKLLRLALLPDDLLPVERHRRHRHLGRAVLYLPGMRPIDERIVRPVVDAVHHLLLPDQADALLEYLLAALVEIDVADPDRPRLLAGDRCVRRVFEPVALLQPVYDAAVEIGDMAGDALDLRVLNRLDD